MFVVVEVRRGLVAPLVRTFGPFKDRQSAEKSRMHRHLDNYLSGARRPAPSTYVAEIEEAP